MNRRSSSTRSFSAWLEAKPTTRCAHFDEWKKGARRIVRAADSGKNDDVIRNGTAIRDWYPDYVEEAASMRCWRRRIVAKDDKAAAIAQLETVSRHRRHEIPRR